MARAKRIDRAVTGGDLEKWLAFAFGVIFVSILLYLATVEKNPTPLAVRIYVTVLALAAAGIGAILPGFLEIRFKNILRAGGAIGLGVLVYLNEPAIGRNVVDWVEPTTTPEKTIHNYLSAIDSNDLNKAWTLLPDLARRHVNNDKDRFASLYRNTLDEAGELTNRTLVGTVLLESPDGAPPGLYKSYTYKTKYSEESSTRLEHVMVRAVDGSQWEIFSHQVSLPQIAE